MNGRVFWVTGLSGAGKTTIGTALYYRLKMTQDNVVLLDGDALKEALSGNAAVYTNEARHKRAYQYARLCKMLADQGIVVICCAIAMFSDVREWNRENIEGYVEVFLDVPRDVLTERDSKKLYSRFMKGEEKNIVGFDLSVDFPKKPDIVIVNDSSKSITECVNEILTYSIAKQLPGNRDELYWNEYYKRQLAENRPSLFAQYVLSQLKDGENLIDLGCGNGRDSLYFHRNNIKVTAIDKSIAAISNIKTAEPLGVKCVCGDITKVNLLCDETYSHCYSRFSIHSLTKEQQLELFDSVHAVLKPGGSFWIEARSVRDSLYGRGERIGEHEFIYTGHYRRFIILEELLDELAAHGFTVQDARESTGFAPYQGDDPVVIRVSAKKK